MCAALRITLPAAPISARRISAYAPHQRAKTGGYRYGQNAAA
jgi:hypothetical protein